MTSVLLVLSAADHWTLIDETVHPTGFWAEEFVAPYEVFAAAGWDITVATPGAKPPTVDRLSLGIAGGLPTKTRRIAAKLDELTHVLAAPADLASIDADDYDVIFYPGGHGPMEDLAVDETSGALITDRLRSGKPLALLCHAPAAAFAARNPDGTWPLQGYRMTALSNREELFNTFARKAKWLLEDRLKEEGAHFEAGLPLRPHIVQDRNLYTGQNPTSSAALARRLVTDLGQPLLNISVSTTIPASPAVVWSLIHDITRTGEFSQRTTAANGSRLTNDSGHATRSVLSIAGRWPPP
nr:type 1 glutamine amidotransferase domain-containing protein [Gordonia sp. NB41Y]